MDSSDEEQLVCNRNVVLRVFGADSVADGMQVETSHQSRATVVASDSALAVAGREFFPDLRLGVQDGAQVEIARSIEAAEPRTPETVVDVFPMTDDAAVPQPSPLPRCRRLVLVPQSPGGTPVSIQDRHSDSTGNLAGAERMMGDGANSHRASVMRRRLVLTSSGIPTAQRDPTNHTPLRETVLARSDDGTLAPTEPVVDDGGEEELGNSSGGDEEEPVTPRVASLEPVVPMMGPVRAALRDLDHVDLSLEFARRANVMKTVSMFLVGPFRNALRLALEEATAREVTLKTS